MNVFYCLRYACSGLLLLLLISCVELSAQNSCPPNPRARVMLLGDSWTHIMWNNRTYQDVFHQFGFGDIVEEGTNTAIGGTTARFWADPANQAVIVNQLQQTPSIDIVLISIGGNDMLAGINGAYPGWHTGLSASAEAIVFDTIISHIQIMIDVIKNVRPNMEIVISGYDYLNLVETVINDPGGPNTLLWANLGQPNALQINSAFARFERRKADIADADPKVHYVQGFGLMQYLFGYPGVFPAYSVPPPGQQPLSYSPFPGGNPDFPTPPIALAAGGTDAIHLSDEGYKHLVVNQTSVYFLNKFRGGPNATFTSEGGSNDGWIRSDGSTGAGEVRVGDNSSGNLYRGVFSFNTSALPDNATITGASLFINRAALNGRNPLTGGFLGNPAIDVKNGTFGNTGIEVNDYFSAADAVDAGCFIGVAPDNGYTIRIDLKPSGYNNINLNGRTQFRLYFQSADIFGTDYITFNSGDQTGLLAPYLDVFYALPPPPATAQVSGDTSLCFGDSTVISVALSGSAPWSITWSDGVTESNITTASHTRLVAPTATANYQVTALSDVNGPGTTTGSAQITVEPEILVSVTGLSSNYCSNSSTTTLFASPPGGSWSGAGINGNIFNPAQAILNNGGGVLTLTYAGTYGGCPFTRDFSVVVDTNICSLAGSCTFSSVTDTVDCVWGNPVDTMTTSSGQLWVYEDLIPGRTYVASTCDSCGYDSHLMVRNEADSTFIAENDDACGLKSSVTFVAPSSGRVGVNLTGDRTFDCNPYNCNPYNCNPYNCNPQNCNPYQCNCQTCYQTCTRDEQVYMTCYPGGVQVINGILTSDCVGACTGGFCWRIRYQVPYDCNPYSCNCQTCYQTCYDTCYQTCYDTCYQTCTDKCGVNNGIACNVKLECVDCVVPTASINASNTSVCFGDSITFTAAVSGAGCNTMYEWNFGADASIISSTNLNPPPVSWATAGSKTITFDITEPGLGSNTYSITINYTSPPTGGVLNGPASACEGDTISFSLDSVQNTTGYSWNFSGGQHYATGAMRELVVPDSLVQIAVVAINGTCVGDTFYHSIQPTTSPLVSISIIGDTALCPGDSTLFIAQADTATTLQWQLNGQPIAGQTGNSLVVYNGGVYSVVATNVAQCASVSNEIVVVDYPAPVGSLIGMADACEGDTVTLSAAYANDTSIQWFANGVALSGIVDSQVTVTDSGSYYVVVSNRYCQTTSNTLLVTFHDIPIADAGSDRTLCEGDTINLTASGATYFNWSTGDTTATISISPAFSQSYMVTVTDVYSCADADTVEVTVYDLPITPTLSITGDTISVTDTYQAYQWYLDGVPIAGATSSNYVIQASGNYQVLVTDSNMCTAISGAVNLQWTGIAVVGANSIINIYPNPGTGIYYLEKDAGYVGQLIIYNVLGEQIMELELQLTVTVQQLDLSKYPAGIYMLHLNNGQVLKLVKQ